MAELKAKHQREVKGMQQEVASARKVSEEKAAKREAEHATHVEVIEQACREKIDMEKKERVKALTQLKDKLRAEHRNALDALKNE